MNNPQLSSATSTAPKPTPDTAALLDSVLEYANAHYAREDWVTARDALCLAVELAPNQTQIRAALGSLQYQLQDYPAACASFTTATTQSPDNPDLHTQLAMVHIALQQENEARAALQRALNLRPDHLTARQLLGGFDFAAIGNDLGCEHVFELPLRRFGQEGDMLVSISSSGNSPNVLRAIACAQELRMHVVTLSGMKADNQSRKMGHLNFYVPASTYGVVESAHAALLHCWLDFLMKNDSWQSKGRN